MRKDLDDVKNVLHGDCLRLSLSIKIFIIFKCGAYFKDKRFLAASTLQICIRSTSCQIKSCFQNRNLASDEWAVNEHDPTFPGVI